LLFARKSGRKGRANPPMPGVRRRPGADERPMNAERAAWHAICTSSGTSTLRRPVMLTWALVFLVLVIASGLLGFTGIANVATEIAQVLFLLFTLLLLFTIGAAIVDAF
jgi:uncharacterized membrane protein YtjA (UPF0391 family)